MFAYCNNNPVNGFDPSGTRFQDPNCRSYDGLNEYTDTGMGGTTYRNYGISMTVKGLDYTITANINYSGPLSSSILTAGIRKYWNGDYTVNGQNIRLNVKIVSTPKEDAIKVHTSEGSARSNSSLIWFVGECSQVYIYQYDEAGGKVDIGWLMAHEFGHCLGVEDYYTHVYKGEPGFDKPTLSIMNGYGMHASSADVVMVIAVFRTGEYQWWS